MSNILNESEFALPHNLLAEQIVLGSMCLDVNLIPYILTKLNIETFYFPEHKLIYKALIQLYEKNKEITLVLIVNYLQEKEILETIGGVPTITNLLNKVVTTINLDKYIYLLQEKYFRRLLILLGKYIIESAYENKKNLEELLIDIESKIYTLTTKRFDNTIGTTTELLSSILLDLQRQFQTSEKLSGLTTSFQDLDTLTQGFQKSELIIVAGRPSMGKTAFCLNIAQNIAKLHKIPVLIFSLEMSKQQLIHRFLSMLTGINSVKIRSGTLTLLEWEKFRQAIKTLSNLPIFIDDTSYINLAEIQVKSRQILQQKNQLGLIIIDYLQLMQLNVKNENRAQELAYITRTLKILAKELNLPIVVLSQLSRNVESRLDKRPILSDLRDSGCLSFNKKAISQIQASPLVKSTNSFLIKKTFLTGTKPNYLLSLEIDFSVTYKHKIFTNLGWLSLDQLNFETQYCYFSKKIQKPLLKLTGKNLIYKKITSVYDLSITKSKNYLTKGYLIHNSIEQDADIVLMLYRDDYYNTKNLSNITEIIVAKHRNGPIGIVKLIFERNSLQFFNCNKEIAHS